MYRIGMRTLLTLLCLITLGTLPAPTVKEPVQKIKTHPVRPRKPTRMIASDAMIVAVIDTGFGKDGLGEGAKLCPRGHRNYTGDTMMATNYGTQENVPLDNHGHGTNIVGTIEKYAGDANYCIVVLKYFSPRSPTSDNLENTVKAINWAIGIGAKVINYSGGGLQRSAAETKAVKAFLDKGGIFVAAAGNETSDIDVKSSYYYPALEDPRVIVVGNAKKMAPEKIELIQDSERDKKTVYVGTEMAYVSSKSNWGFRVNVWEYGENVEAYGITMTGTSQATAIRTGKIIKELASVSKRDIMKPTKAIRSKNVTTDRTRRNQAN